MVTTYPRGSPRVDAGSDPGRCRPRPNPSWPVPSPPNGRCMMSASSRPTTGVAVLALLAVLDISYLALAWFGALGSADAPPTGVLILFAAVGVVTLTTVQPAQRGNRNAAWIMVGSRVVSVLLIDLPAYALGAP